jgi:hypothetical protein
MIKTIAIALAALFMGGQAFAQTTTYYGPNGQYRGQSQTYGGNTTYYGPSGQYQGQSQTNSFGSSSTTTLYGPSGQYRGTIQRTR